MPGLPHKNLQSGTGPVFLNGIWSNHHGHVSFDQIQKFWNELSHTARQRLLRIDKQTLFEQIRKNLYCSRCNGLLLEAFSQIVLYGKSLQLDGAVHIRSKPGSVKKQIDNGSAKISSNCEDDVQDPSVHPWGGLIASRDGILTLLDCFLYGESLEALQNVFDSARARERECELLYPDACGGGGRGWMSQGMASCGRGHGNRESCALHTARLSCDTLVDFWSALGDETRQSLLQMKEEDFIERLMYRFESKRFCRDCRRNVIREFKELKELKRMRRETRCTDWFCVADSAFQYEVSEDTVQADWHQSFTDAVGMYHHFEWAVGTGEGKSDILEFENVGTNGSVLVNGLDLGGLSACFITLRAWKIDGRFNEFTVKAHSLKGQSCVHRRLTVGDGFVTITKGESIRSFFECAEEVEEEEDDDSSDKDGNEPDGDGFRSQRHAKSPELAREFLLDAATVIFKDQVEKAFREGTARQNAHSTFVCLALKLLEERVHVACKEIITLEKQIKLLEEEENEKREEEERKERRRTKERERKLRRKERLKEKEREKNFMGPKQLPIASQTLIEDMAPSAEEEQHCPSNLGESMNETGDIMPVSTLSSDIVDDDSTNECINLQSLENSSSHHTCDFIGEINVRDGSFVIEQLKHSRQKARFRKDSLADPAPNWCERHHFISSIEGGFLVDEDDSKLQACVAASSKYMNGPQRQSRNNSMKHNARNCGPKFGEKFHFSNNRMRDGYDFHSCSYNSLADYRSKDGQPTSVIRSGRVFRTENSKKHNYGSYVMDKCGVRRAKHVMGKILPARDVLPTKKVWEPTESRKRYPRSKSDLDVSLMSSASNTCDGNGNVSQKANGILNSCDEPFSSELSENLGECGGLSNCQSHEESASDPLVSTSGSDNCSSCLSEGDSSIQVTESPLTSDSDVASQQSEGRENSSCSENAIHNCPDVAADEKCKTSDHASLTGKITSTLSEASCLEGKQSIKYAHSSAEEIMYSKANSEAEYTDHKTLLERTNDAINTIIRRDESTESGELLQPCIEAALNLGCIPRRASRSQRHNPRFYLSSTRQEASETAVAPKIPENTFYGGPSNVPQPTFCNTVPSSTLQFTSNCSALLKTTRLPACLRTDSGRSLHDKSPSMDRAHVTCHEFPPENFSFPILERSSVNMATYPIPNSGRMYPLYYSSKHELIYPSKHPQDSNHDVFTVSKPHMHPISEAKTGFLQNALGYNNTLGAPNQTAKGTSYVGGMSEKARDMRYDLSLRLGPPPASSLSRENSSFEEVGSSSSRDGQKFCGPSPCKMVASQFNNCSPFSLQREREFCFFPDRNANDFIDTPMRGQSSVGEGSNSPIRKRKAPITSSFEDGHFFWWQKPSQNQFFDGKQGPT